MLVVLEMLASQNTNLQQNSLRKNWMPDNFSATTSCHCTSPQLLRSMMVSTSSQLYPHTRLFFLFECLDIQFFNWHTCVTYGTSCRARGHSRSCLEKQRISLGVAIILGISLCSHTQLDCNQFTIILNLYLSMSILKNFCLW